MEDDFDLSPSVGSAAQAPTVLTIGALNRQVATLLGRQFPLLWVRGEISNFTRAASGHCYFSLKDDQAQARAVLFRSRAASVPFDLRNGLKVDAQVIVGLYEPRGEYQLNVERLKAAGAGDLHQQFLLLRDRLQREGLFDERVKRPLAVMPAQVGVITSLQAAALRDVLITLARRAPHIPVIVYPTPVQGVEAAARIVAALAVAAQDRRCDTLLLVRGGGAIEDLWSFNDERVARAIRASPIPVVVGVGHESDVTIADFAADLRAATPTAAAMAAVPARELLLVRTEEARTALVRAMQRVIDQRSQRTDTAARLLKTPREQWRGWRNRLALAAAALVGARRRHAAGVERRLAELSRRLRGPNLQAERVRLDRLESSLGAAHRRLHQRAVDRVDALAAQLALVDPDRVLRRGYAVVRDSAGRVVVSVATVRPEDCWQVTLADGDVRARVSGVDPAIVVKRLEDPPG